jgi:hypothetical protein
MEAERLLEVAEKCNPGPWGNHSRIAARCAEKIASACRGMDPEKAYILGLLHDIGRKFGVRHLGHVSDGYSYMMSLGYDEVARICLTHSFNNMRLDEYIGNVDTSDEEYELIRTELSKITPDDYDRLIQLCDSLAADYGFVILEKRFVDVTRRHGIMEGYIKGWEIAFSIKDYFEKEMGCSIYDVLPDIGRTSLLTPKPWTPGTK